MVTIILPLFSQILFCSKVFSMPLLLPMGQFEVIPWGFFGGYAMNDHLALSFDNALLRKLNRKQIILSALPDSCVQIVFHFSVPKNNLQMRSVKLKERLVLAYSMVFFIMVILQISCRALYEASHSA